MNHPANCSAVHVEFSSLKHQNSALRNLNVALYTDMECAMDEFIERYDILYVGVRMEMVAKVIEHIICGGFISLFSFVNKKNEQWCWRILDIFGRHVYEVIDKEIDDFHPDEVLDEVKSIFYNEIKSFVYVDLCNAISISVADSSAK